METKEVMKRRAANKGLREVISWINEAIKKNDYPEEEIEELMQYILTLLDVVIDKSRLLMMIPEGDLNQSGWRIK